MYTTLISSTQSPLPPQKLFDTATGLPITEAVYLNHLGKKYVFDRLTLTIWFTFFPNTCPFTGNTNYKIHTLHDSNTHTPAQASPFCTNKPHEVETYQSFCKKKAINYSKKLTYLLTARTAPKEIFILSITSIIWIMLLSLPLLDPLFATTVLVIITSVLFYKILVWINPEIFLDKADLIKLENNTDPNPYIHPCTKTLVTYLQLQRLANTDQVAPVDLDPYNTQQTKIGLETMRYLFTDALLSDDTQKCLKNLPPQRVLRKETYKAKHLTANFWEQVEELFSLGLPCAIEETTCPVKADTFPTLTQRVDSSFKAHTSRFEQIENTLRK